MKPTSQIIIFILVILTSMGSAYAQSPREQFRAAVEAYQQNATEDNVRKIAELYKQLAPPPALPEEAEFHAQKGAAFVKLAKSPADFERAAKEFQTAVSLAPWNAEYHYNLAVCYKSAEQFNSALASLKFAQILARDDKERRDTLGLRAEIEAAQEMAAKQQAEANSPQAREAALLAKVNGAQFVRELRSPSMGSLDDIYEVNGRSLLYKVKIYSLPRGTYFGHGPGGPYSIGSMPLVDGAFTWTDPYIGTVTVFIISSDGQLMQKGTKPDGSPALWPIPRR